MYILFNDKGVCINGFAHESEINNSNIQKDLKNYSGIVDGLPNEFEEFMFGELVKSMGTTFCVWRLNDDQKWNIGDIKITVADYGDGSEDLLNSYILSTPKKFKKYIDENFYDGSDQEIDLKIVKDIFNGKVLTKEMVLKINPEITDFESLKKELDAINYKYEF